MDRAARKCSNLKLYHLNCKIQKQNKQTRCKSYDRTKILWQHGLKSFVHRQSSCLIIVDTWQLWLQCQVGEQLLTKCGSFINVQKEDRDAADCLWLCWISVLSHVVLQVPRWPQRMASWNSLQSPSFSHLVCNITRTKMVRTRKTKVCNPMTHFGHFIQMHTFFTSSSRRRQQDNKLQNFTDSEYATCHVPAFFFSAGAVRARRLWRSSKHLWPSVEAKQSQKRKYNQV